MQNWIRWGIRFKLFWYVLKPCDRLFAVPFFGKTYFGNLNSYVDRCAYFFGAHGREEMMYMGTLVPKDGVVLDIGGNVGHHTLYFSTKAQEVHAFEPDPELGNRLLTLMSKNNVTNVILHRVGVGDVHTQIPYYQSTGENKGVGSFVEGLHPTNEKLSDIEVVRIDDLSFPRVDFVKIDAEGFERRILAGMKETMRRCRPSIVLEYIKGDFKSEEDFNSMFEGYTAYTIEVNRPLLYFFNRPTAKIVPFIFDRFRAEVLLKPNKA